MRGNQTGGAGNGTVDEAKAKADAEAKAKADAEAKAKADAEQAAAAITRAATPVVRVTAVRDRWRAKRFWPKGDTDLTLAEAEQLGQEGFEQLRGDDVFTITPLDAD